MKFWGGFVLLILLLTACERAGVREFLGCTWDIDGLIERDDGTFAHVSANPLNERDFEIAFHSEAFEESVLDDGFDLVEVKNLGSGIEIRRYLSTGETALAGIEYSVILRQGVSGYVSVLNQDYGEVLVECQ